MRPSSRRACRTTSPLPVLGSRGNLPVPPRPPPLVRFADGRLRRRRRRNHDPGRAQHLVAELVALLDDLDHGPLCCIGRLRQQRLMDMGIELALGRDLGKALLRQQLGKSTVDESNAILELRRFMISRRLEPLQPVEELVPFSLEGLDVEALFSFLRLFCDLRVLGHYAFGASCSSSMTS